MLTLLPALFTAALPLSTRESQVAPVRKVTPVLVVERIEPSLVLWVDRLGFEKTVEVPEGDHLGFVILARNGVEIMYQTRQSVEIEIETIGFPEALRTPANSRTTLFCEVADLEEVRGKLDGFEVLLPYRKTPYGAEELWMREPGGHIIGFAQLPEPAP